MKRYLARFSIILLGFFIIYGIYLLGEFIQHALHLPIPGNVIGFILMFFFLETGILKEKIIEDASNLLIGYLILFFIPYLVRIITYKSLMRREAFAITLSLFGSYIVVLFFASWFFKLLMLRRKR